MKLMLNIDQQNPINYVLQTWFSLVIGSPAVQYRCTKKPRTDVAFSDDRATGPKADSTLLKEMAWRSHHFYIGGLVASKELGIPRPSLPPKLRLHRDSRLRPIASMYIQASLHTCCPSGSRLHKMLFDWVLGWFQKYAFKSNLKSNHSTSIALVLQCTNCFSSHYHVEWPIGQSLGHLYSATRTSSKPSSKC